MPPMKTGNPCVCLQISTEVRSALEIQGLLRRSNAITKLLAPFMKHWSALGSVSSMMGSLRGRTINKMRKIPDICANSSSRLNAMLNLIEHEGTRTPVHEIVKALVSNAQDGLLPSAPEPDLNHPKTSAFNSNSGRSIPVVPMMHAETCTWAPGLS